MRRATACMTLMLRFYAYFYPRSPCGERLCQLCRVLLVGNFYPRSPCGERPFEKFEGVMVTKISIHALLAESDSFPVSAHRFDSGFLSTLSLRRATRRVLKCDNRAIISIHALLAESDDSTASRTWAAPYFYPRSPCGERLWSA